jgi:hypothetical protein
MEAFPNIRLSQNVVMIPRSMDLALSQPDKEEAIQY